MIAIIDYDMGNLHSVKKGIERLGFQGVVTDDKEVILQAEGVILPGVGAFGDAMRNLREKSLVAVIKQLVEENKPLLGICLGMQLLFSASKEHGNHQGLDILKGNIKRFVGDFKVPHMGWNQLIIQNNQHFLTKDLAEDYVYFVHSYYAEIAEPDILLAATDYFGIVPAIVSKNKVIGMQFHPEKSGKLGMELLARFVKWSEKV